jgi:hypothetical protein
MFPRGCAIRAYDSSILAQWLLDAPAVGLWLAEQIGKRIQGVTDVAAYWRNMLGTLRKELPPEILLTNRQGTAKKLAEWAAGNPGPLAVRATSPREVVDVFAAWVHALPIAEADAVASRTIIVEDAETWKALATSKQSLILIADPRLETTPELLAAVAGSVRHRGGPWSPEGRPVQSSRPRGAAHPPVANGVRALPL